MEVLEELEPLAPDERAPRLAGMNLSPPQLREVQAGLETHADAVEFLESPPVIAPDGDGAPESLSPPTQIGQYRILRVVGEGGMGVVYEAEQQRPHRRVALKVIRPGYISVSMMRRFEYEADVLARLEHPGIARIYEAGIAQTEVARQPFFAMEFVDGQRLDRFIASTSPPINKRLELLIRICHAVQHAHTKGIIHRDLKPANILITADGSPKILDFGVARMTDSDIQATTLHTQSGQLIGTLPYMAPEQASGKVNALDTSSDVYALGVIAYELLSGRMPYSLEGKALHEAVRVICEEEPSRLSSLDRNLRGDVETIIQKALEKDRTRRYATAGELAADVKRFLDYEPISARRPSTWYQLRKFARRNRALVTGAVAAFLGLCLLSISLAVGFVRERQLRHQLLTEQEQSKAFSSFLSDEILAGANPERLRDAAVSATVIKALIEPAAQRVGEKLHSTPLVEATVRFELCRLLRDTGRIDLAIPQLERATEIRKQLLGDDHPDTLICLSGMAVLLEAQGKFTEAEPIARDAVQRHRRVLGDDNPSTLTAVGVLCRVLAARGKLAEAEPLFKEVLERRRRVLGEDDPNTINSLNNYGSLLFAMQRLAEAGDVFKEVWERYRRTKGEDYSDAIGALNNYAVTLRYQGRLADAEPLLKQSLELTRRVLGEDHPDTIQSLGSYAEVLRSLDRAVEAEPLSQVAVEKARRVNGDAHPETLRAMMIHGRVLMALGRAPDAEPLLAELYDRAKTAEITPDQATSYIASYGLCLVSLSRFEAAESPLREAHRRLREIHQASHPLTQQVLEALATVCEKTDRSDEAARLRAEIAAAQAATRPTAP